MTKKDFVLIAGALRASKPERFRAGAEDAQWCADCNRLADALATTNPRFDRARFLQACGVAS